MRKVHPRIEKIRENTLNADILLFADTLLACGKTFAVTGKS